MPKQPERTEKNAASWRSLKGKTIASVGHDSVEGSWGPEPMTVLWFTDGTWFGFVHPADED